MSEILLQTIGEKLESLEIGMLKEAKANRENTILQELLKEGIEMYVQKSFANLYTKKVCCISLDAIKFMSLNELNFYLDRFDS